MYKTAFVVLAALSLSACASFAPVDALNAAVPSHFKSDLSQADGATREPIEVTDLAIDAPAAVATAASPAPARRAFGYPTRRQPDLRLVLATATDRARFYRRRRARRGRA